MAFTRQRLSLFYLYALVSSFRFTDSLWILYLLHSGWTLMQIGLAEAGFHVVAFLSEVPTGAFADRYGKRVSLAVGLVFGALTTLALYLSAGMGFLPGLVAVSLGALAWTFASGADRALLYEISEHSAEGVTAYPRLYGQMVGIWLVAGAVAGAAGGWLTTLGWAWPFALTVLTRLLALITVVLLPEPSPGERAETRPGSLLTAVRGAGAAVWEQRGLLVMIAFGVVFGTATTLNHLYAQTSLPAKGAGVSLTTTIIAVANLLTALGSTLGGRLAARPAWLRGALVLGPLTMAALLMVVGGAPLWTATPAFLLLAVADGWIEPAYDGRLNALAPGPVRATVLSLQNAGFSLAMIVFFPLFGWAGQRLGLAWPYAATAAVLLVLAFAMLRERE